MLSRLFLLTSMAVMLFYGKSLSETDSVYGTFLQFKSLQSIILTDDFDP